MYAYQTATWNIVILEKESCSAFGNVGQLRLEVHVPPSEGGRFSYAQGYSNYILLFCSEALNVWKKHYDGRRGTVLLQGEVKSRNYSKHRREDIYSGSSTVFIVSREPVATEFRYLIVPGCALANTATSVWVRGKWWIFFWQFWSVSYWSEKWKLACPGLVSAKGSIINKRLLFRTWATRTGKFC